MILTRRRLLGSTLLTLIAAPAFADTEDGFTLLEAREGEAQILPAPAPPTKIWGFGGQTPGPLLRVKLGEEIKARLVNKLTQPTSLHWRGMRLPNALDGAAGLVQTPVAPGETRDFRFTPPDAGTYLYQPLIQPNSGEQMARGLCGLVIVDEKDKIFADEELTLVLSDWRLDAGAQIIDDFDHPSDILRQGRLGAVAAINGRAKIEPLSCQPGTRLRLRLVNAASARMMVLGIDGGAAKIIGIDGQFCDPFEPAHRTVPAAPGARFDLLLDLPPQEGQKTKLILRGEAELPDVVLLEIVTKGAPRPPAPPIVAEKPNPLLPAEIHLEKAKRVELVFDGGAQANTPAGFKPKPEELRQIWRINGRASTGIDGPPLFSVKAGTPVTLALVNKALYPLVIHVQGHVMRLLHDLDDGWEPYWRDSVVAPAKATKHVAFIADNPGKWLICDAIQDHFANGLAGWFEVA